MRLSKIVFLSFMSVVLLIVLTACGSKQHQSSDQKSLQTSNYSKSNITNQNSKPGITNSLANANNVGLQQSTNKKNKKPFPNQQGIIKNSIRNYKHSMPGELPATSMSFNFIVKVPLKYIHSKSWSNIAFFNYKKGTYIASPYRNIHSHNKGDIHTFKRIPSASMKHMNDYGFGVKPDYNMNWPIEFYTNHSLKQNDFVDFLMGYAMGGYHFVEKLNGGKVSKGKMNNDLNGSWFQLQIGKWYRLMNVGPSGKKSLYFEFKITR